jgi:hypothetical protein
VAHPYSPSASGSTNQRVLLDDAMEAVATATRPRVWPLADLKAVTERSIGHMKDTGVLVVETIPEGRFRNGLGFKANRDVLTALLTEFLRSDPATTEGAGVAGASEVPSMASAPIR